MAIDAYRSAESGGVGAIGRDGKLVDAAHMRHAATTLRKAGLPAGGGGEGGSSGSEGDAQRVSSAGS